MTDIDNLGARIDAMAARHGIDMVGIRLGIEFRKYRESICSQGKTILVGEFFWIPEGAFIGYDRDARHGHGLRDKPGSVDAGCTVTVRGVTGGHAIVRLDRPETPYGAPAPIGTVFRLPVEQIERWPAMIEARRAHENERRSLARRYCR